MINRVLIDHRLSFILEAAQELDALAEKPAEAFVGDRRTFAMAESFLRRH